jgi:hypothetical protein
MRNSGALTAVTEHIRSLLVGIKSMIKPSSASLPVAVSASKAQLYEPDFELDGKKDAEFVQATEADVLMHALDFLYSSLINQGANQKFLCAADGLSLLVIADSVIFIDVIFFSPGLR